MLRLYGIKLNQLLLWICLKSRISLRPSFLQHLCFLPILIPLKDATAEFAVQHESITNFNAPARIRPKIYLQVFGKVGNTLQFLESGNTLTYAWGICTGMNPITSSVLRKARLLIAWTPCSRWTRAVLHSIAQLSDPAVGRPHTLQFAMEPQSSNSWGWCWVGFVRGKCPNVDLPDLLIKTS